MKILLTSTGFDNENIKNKFIELLPQNPENTKVLFIITAAQDPDSVRILSACLDDLTKCNIKDENITIYDMHKTISQQELNKYHAIYVCGGNTDYLEQRIEEINIQQNIKKYIENGGIYVGVSAGSIVAAKTYPNGLNLIRNQLDVHSKNHSENGQIKQNQAIYLSDDQALLITETEQIIFE